MAIQSLVFIMILLLLDQEETHHDDLCDSSSDDDDSSVESLSDETTTSSEESVSTVSSQTLTEANFGDLVPADLVNYDDGDGVARDGDEDEDDDDDDEDCCYDDEDLDDELILRSVSKKLKRQRLCKLGKRTFAKIPFTQLKRGCIYGKYGLGIRFRC